MLAQEGQKCNFSRCAVVMNFFDRNVYNGLLRYAGLHQSYRAVDITWKCDIFIQLFIMETNRIFFYSNDNSDSSPILSNLTHMSYFRAGQATPFSRIPRPTNFATRTLSLNTGTINY